MKRALRCTINSIKSFILNESGMSLIEVVSAVAILGLLAPSLSQMFVQSIKYTRQSERKTEVLAAGNRCLEERMNVEHLNITTDWVEMVYPEFMDYTLIVKVTRMGEYTGVSTPDMDEGDALIMDFTNADILKVDDYSEHFYGSLDKDIYIYNDRVRIPLASTFYEFLGAKDEIYVKACYNIGNNVNLMIHNMCDREIRVRVVGDTQEKVHIACMEGVLEVVQNLCDPNLYVSNMEEVEIAVRVFDKANGKLLDERKAIKIQYRW